ncbi:MAG: DUF952 domain-containing protein [Candidatus Bathyarchaeota archaeon]|nr:DUF952 domain-containing protein [Candidatus Bathyarchaeota archaeon]
MNAQKTGTYRVESLDTEGFIHMSKDFQLIQVANSQYLGQTDLLLLNIDYSKVENNTRWKVKLELGEDYPHY